MIRIIEAEASAHEPGATFPTIKRTACKERLERTLTVVLTYQCSKPWSTCPRCDQGYPTPTEAAQCERWCKAAGRPVLAKHEAELARKRRAARRAGDKPAIASPRVRRKVGKGVC